MKKQLKLKSGTFTYTKYESTEYGNKSYKTNKKRIPKKTQRDIAVEDGGLAVKIGEFYWICF